MLIGLSPLGATATASATAVAAGVGRPLLDTGGYSTSALSLSTVTDTLPGLDAVSYATRTGAVVVRTYKLTNHGEADIVRIAIRDPDADGPVRCGPGGRGPLKVPAWSSATCTVRFAAVAGAHRSHVVASGTVDGIGASVSTSADAGYFAATPRLRVSVSLGVGAGAGHGVTARAAVAVPIGTALHATYTVSNAGDIALVNVAVADSQPVNGLSCGAGTAEISVLPPGASRVCTSVLRAAAGLRNSVAAAVGTEPERSISASGPGAPISVEAVAYSAYTGICGPATSPAVPSSASAAVSSSASPAASTSSGVRPSGHTDRGLSTSPKNAAYTGSLPPIVVGGGQAAVHGAPAQVHRQDAHSQSVGSSGGQSLPALVRHHRRTFSLLTITLIVVLVPAVRHLLRRNSSGRA